MANDRRGGFATPQDFESLARQYWGAWGEAMRGAMPGAAPSGTQAWHDAIDWWTQYAYGGRSEVNDALARFNDQARRWYAQMQQVATQFAGQDAAAADIARAWKQALGAAGENPFPEMFRGMRGQGLQGIEQWIEDASPYLEAWRSEAASWLRMPAFGFAREHQARWQHLAEAQLDHQQKLSAYNALMLKASQSAYEIFERKLAEREEPGRQIDSPRALFDLWVDAAEEAYAEIALSQEFRRAYGELVNAQMRLRAGVQQQVEQASALFGMPTRSELDGAHRKIVELERSVRRLRDAMTTSAPRPASAKADEPDAPAAKPEARAPRGKAKANAEPAKRSKPAQRSDPPRRSKPPKPSKPQKQTAPRPARKAAPRPATRSAPSNGFSTLIPLAVEPLPVEIGRKPVKSKPAKRTR